ncbi:MAG TPA: polynucleotide kinase-phosphatase [Streptosporangiaceae bacterium]|nr:polynucleotide kinase-phosphatase [Streptosporangiaceae bacterium]
MTVIKIPDLSLVALVGVSGSGKSTFAARHFLPTEVISSDFCRGLVADDPNDQSATADAFDVLNHIAGKRLAAGRLTVIDATSVQPAARRSLIELARQHHVLAVAIVLDLSEAACAARNAARPDRAFGRHVLRQQHTQLRRGLGGLRREGFHRVFVLRSEAEMDAATIEREPLWNDRRDDHGPFDIIGDVHGCYGELAELLGKLGYAVDADGASARHPEGRTAVFVGDLVDRGPATPAVLRLVMGMTAEGSGVSVAGNHEVKLVRALRGRNVSVGHGLAQSLAQLAAEPPGFSEQVAAFADRLLSHLMFDDGKLVVAHAGLPAAMHGRASAAVRAFALYGDTTGETDSYGLPVRYPWAQDYRGRATVVYGHTPVPETTWVNGTICLDTGCVFGGKLTALRYPERELVSVPAREVYYEPARPLAAAGHPGAAGGSADDGREPCELDIGDVTGKRIIQTRLTGSTVTIREENAAAALEVMSRFAIDPRWLIYLPPTMSPAEASRADGLLEHPSEAFAGYRAAGVTDVICEEKHMGSRAIVITCASESVAGRRFGAGDGSSGVIYTRTGRAFFGDRSVERELVGRVTAAASAAGLWRELGTDWLALDCELLPWSAKAGELLRGQYAQVGAAATAAMDAELPILAAAAARGVDVDGLLQRTAERAEAAAGFVAAYRRYCWPVGSVDDLRLAPFQILAGEGSVHATRGHAWHLAVLGRLCDRDPAVLRQTRSVPVQLGGAASEDAAIAWWRDLTAAGGEGMVVKPAGAIHLGPKGLAQPGVKCRGPEYLRLIYGPEYSSERNLARLRSRGVGHKRSLALREFALGIEALERFVAGEPLYRVHECVFGVLALESEPVDPRL